MTRHAASQRRLFTAIWLVAAVVICWLQVTTIKQQFTANQSLGNLSQDKQAATLAAMDRFGFTGTTIALYWLIASVAIMPLYIAFGWLLVRRGSPIGFSSWLAVVMLAMTSMIYPPDIPEALPDQPVHQAIVRLATMIGVSGFFILPLVFPDGRFVPRWTALLAIYLLLELASFVWTGNPLIPTTAEIDTILSLALLAIVIGSAIHRYRRISTATQRLQTRWVLFGFIVGLPSFLIGDAMMRTIDDSVRGSVFLIGFPLFVLIGFNTPFVTVACAMLYHRLFDIDVVLGRTLVWLAMTALVVGTYIAIVLGLGTLLHTDDNLVLSLIATGLVAVGFQPLRERVQRMVNRFVFGDRDDPYAVVFRLGQRLTSTTTISGVLPQLADVIAESLRLPYVGISLLRPDGLELAAAVGSPTPGMLRTPLVWQGEPVGSLDVAPRGTGESFNTTDRRLLENLASQIGLAAHAISLAQDLQASRERLATGREEERRRIRRDLHDGLGAHLAALTMQTSVARSLVRTNPDRAETELDILRQELRSAIEEIRTLVRGLRPPALDDLGLAGALHAYLDRIGRGTKEQPLALTLTIAEPLPRISAATEAAAYRIIEEAVTNVIRHANATTLRISMWQEGPLLRVEICDDGLGIPANAIAGVGTHSMRERAAELGGCLTVTCRPGGRGTIVHADLPLELGA
ncbi:MAG: sensor histidine kinase [Thermomicrobiales bacterium]